MEYAFITDLEDVAALASSELFALAQVWEERRQALEGSGVFQEFMRRLYREWAIETGLIERLYHWDRGVTELLIEQGIEASLIAHRGNMSRDQAEGVAALIQDQRHVVQGLFDFVKSERALSESYIRELHAEFTRQQESIPAETPDGRRIEVKLLKGEYKQQPNNPRREDGFFHPYCPPEFVSDEMECLLAWYHRHVHNRTPPEVLAAFLHHRFTQIHPFQDGNGRVARALSSLVFIKHGLFPLVIRDEERRVYIEALEQADQGRLKSLCDLFVRGQRRSILKALEVEQQLPENRHAEAILSSGLRLLRNRLQRDERWSDVILLADLLFELTKIRTKEIESYFEFNKKALQIPRSDSYDLEITLGNNNGPFGLAFENNVEQISKHFNYQALFDMYHAVIIISINSNILMDFVVSFHGIGPVNKGVIAVSSFTIFRGKPKQGQRYKYSDPQPASSEFFQFNYKEDEGSVVARFKPWLEESLAIGLAEWHKSVAREMLGENGAA
ncbi:MAG: Fic family protein [Magnetococcus sp. YQC-9]